MFQKVLIANRGEIARRVIRTCKRLGIKTVAVYSDADKDLPFVFEADEAVHIGGASPVESYLSIANIIEAARNSKADAIHPGYGFLSENSTLMAACRDAHITFIGPRPDAAERMGNKTQARDLVRKAGIPVVPGTPGPVTDLEEAKAHAVAMTFPVIVKAAAGGGGIGMQVVHSEEALEKALDAARTRAASAFGDASVYIEKYVEGPHHIEIQILGDGKGNIHHVFERECSVQRRHQKIIEESPSPFVDADLRAKMTKMAIEAGAAVDYVNAGTIECLVDMHKHFYFLEMNTRLQVEHPVTEMVSGLDLVEQQLRIAAGEGITFNPATLVQKGHAIEARIYAENPNNFFPSPGLITRYEEPAGEHIRVDSGYAEGNEVSMHYDPMIAKLIVWGEDRTAAIKRLRFALDNYIVEGPKTNIPFLKVVCDDPDFLAGKYDTHFVDKLQKRLKEQKIKL
jgi:acetyl-CoA carboxylase, biotin carboxylase subunit